MKQPPRQELERLLAEREAALAQAQAIQAAVGDVLHMIGEAPHDPQRVLDAISERATRLCAAEMGAVTLLDGSVVQLSALHGVTAPDGLVALHDMFPLPLADSYPAGRAIMERAPVQLPSLSDATFRFSHVGVLASMGCCLSVPMLDQDRCIGSLSVMRAKPGTFSTETVALLQTFAAQAVIAIVNARLLRDTRNALDQQTAMAEVLRVISGSVADTAPVFEKILDSCEQLFATDSLGIFVVGEDEKMHVAAVRGVESDAVAATYPAPLRDTVGYAAITARRTIHIPDVAAVQADLPSTARALYERVGNFSMMLAPMLWEDRGIGVIGVRRTPPKPFSDKEIVLLSTFADQAVIAIQNARLFNETREALEQQTATAEVLKVIGSSVEDTAPVFDKIIDSCRHLFGTKQIVVFMEREDGQVALAAHRGPVSPVLESMFPRLARESIHDVATRAGRTVHYADVAKATARPPDMQEVYEKTGNHSLAIAPMMWEGRGIGSVVVGRYPPKPFSAKELALLTTFADQAVIAIQNSRLFHETKEALEQQTATAEVLRVISSSVADTQPVFEKILDSCQRLFGSTHVGLYLVDDDGILRGGLHRGEGAQALNEKLDQLGGLPLEVTVSYPALQSGRALHYPDWSLIADDNPWHRAYYDALGNLSAVVAPMLWEGRGIGTIGVMRAGAERRPFSEKEIALISTFADQAVIAIENARLFREIERKSRELAAANEHKSEFLANMSHELRTPLNAIIGFSEVLLERMFGELNDKQADYLQDIHSSGKHLLSLINDILDLSKIEAGRMELDLEEFDVASALGNTLTLIRERAQQHGIALSLVADDDLGTAHADQRKFKQIMLNLLSNAVKFTPDDGRIEVRATVVGDRIEVAVRDTGIGIAANDQEVIFQEFRQVGGHYTNKQEGSGLGLALTRRFVELHSGSLRVDSAPGRGSTFTFTLPRQP